MKKFILYFLTCFFVCFSFSAFSQFITAGGSTAGALGHTGDIQGIINTGTDICLTRNIPGYCTMQVNVWDAPLVLFNNVNLKVLNRQGKGLTTAATWANGFYSRSANEFFSIQDFSLDPDVVVSCNSSGDMHAMVIGKAKDQLDGLDIKDGLNGGIWFHLFKWDLGNHRFEYDQSFGPYGAPFKPSKPAADIVLDIEKPGSSSKKTLWRTCTYPNIDINSNGDFAAVWAEEDLRTMVVRTTSFPDETINGVDYKFEYYKVGNVFSVTGNIFSNSSPSAPPGGNQRPIATSSGNNIFEDPVGQDIFKTSESQFWEGSDILLTFGTPDVSISESHTGDNTVVSYVFNQSYSGILCDRFSYPCAFPSLPQPLRSKLESNSSSTIIIQKHFSKGCGGLHTFEALTVQRNSALDDNCYLPNLLPSNFIIRRFDGFVGDWVPEVRTMIPDHNAPRISAGPAFGGNSHDANSMDVDIPFSCRIVSKSGDGILLGGIVDVHEKWFDKVHFCLNDDRSIIINKRLTESPRISQYYLSNPVITYCWHEDQPSIFVAWENTAAPHFCLDRNIAGRVYDLQGNPLQKSYILLHERTSYDQFSPSIAGRNLRKENFISVSSIVPTLVPGAVHFGTTHDNAIWTGSKSGYGLTQVSGPGNNIQWGFRLLSHDGFGQTTCTNN
jgi:hypothetical protein